VAGNVGFTQSRDYPVRVDQILGGLLPTRFAKRVRFSGKNRTVIDGPFAETKEVVAGFALWEVKSLEEAVEWVKKSPNPMLGKRPV
jgi:hypothetical protein